MEAALRRFELQEAFEAERKAGEMLAGIEMATGGRGKTASNALGVLGITHTQSSRWQRAAAVPE
jgi:hypothetical protein